MTALGFLVVDQHMALDLYHAPGYGEQKEKA